MDKIRFNDRAFKAHVAKWVKEVGSDDFTRAWEVVVGCLAVHAKVDRQSGQSASQARREAYEDFALGFEGEQATYAMIGMLHEFEQTCPDDQREEGEFQRVVDEAIALARGESLSDAVLDDPRADPPEPGDPRVLTVLPGGRAWARECTTTSCSSGP